jgi:hypothetical protein
MARITIPLPWTPVLITRQTFAILFLGACLGNCVEFIFVVRLSGLYKSLLAVSNIYKISGEISHL